MTERSTPDPIKKTPRTDSDPENFFSYYLQEIGTIPLLTPEEERELALKIHLGRLAQKTQDSINLDEEEQDLLRETIQQGQAARHRFIECNLKLVVSIARKYPHHILPITELTQAGNIGLIQAVDGFDPERGNKFSTYAIPTIHREIQAALNEASSPISMPQYIRPLLRCLKQGKEILQQKLGREPTMAELIEQTNIDQGTLFTLLPHTYSFSSLDAPIPSSDGESFLRDTIADPNEPTEEAMVNLRSAAIQQALNHPSISATQRKALQLRFGLLDGHSRTLEEAGQELGRTKERVRQLVGSACTKLAAQRVKLIDFNE